MQSITTKNGETEITHGNEMISVKAPEVTGEESFFEVKRAGKVCEYTSHRKTTYKVSHRGNTNNNRIIATVIFQNRPENAKGIAKRIRYALEQAVADFEEECGPFRVSLYF